jgi:hypothetical protein
MKWEGNLAGFRRLGLYATFLSGKLKEYSHLGDLRLDRRISFCWILNKDSGCDLDSWGSG